MLHRHALILAQGDPGLFDVFKKIVAVGSKVGTVGLGFLAGGGLPGAALRLLQSRGKPTGGVPAAAPRIAPSSVRAPELASFASGNIRTIPLSLQAGPGPPLAVAGGAVMSSGCPSGFHPNKSTYSTASGVVEKGTRCVRNRRRNLSNGRANTRALRRMAAWDKQERKLGKTLKAIVRGR